MSNAAVAAGARPLDPNWAMGSLLYTEHGMNGGTKVHDLSKLISPHGSSLAKISVLDCFEPIAPLGGTVGHQGTSAFKAMAEAMGAGDATVGTAAFRKAAGPRRVPLSPSRPHVAMTPSPAS